MGQSEKFNGKVNNGANRNNWMLMIMSVTTNYKEFIKSLFAGIKQLTTTTEDELHAIGGLINKLDKLEGNKQGQAKEVIQLIQLYHTNVSERGALLDKMLRLFNELDSNLEMKVKIYNDLNEESDKLFDTKNCEQHF